MDLGGVLVKDRLWIFGAYDRVGFDGDGTTGGEVGIRDDDGDGSPCETTDNLYSGKLTWNATPSTNAVATVFADPSRSEGASGANPYRDRPASRRPSASINRPGTLRATSAERISERGSRSSCRRRRSCFCRAAFIATSTVSGPRTQVARGRMCVPGAPPGTRKTPCTLPDEPDCVSGGYGGVRAATITTRRRASNSAGPSRSIKAATSSSRAPTTRTAARKGWGSTRAASTFNIETTTACPTLRTCSSPSIRTIRPPCSATGRGPGSRTTARISRIRGGRRPV